MLLFLRAASFPLKFSRSCGTSAVVYIRDPHVGKNVELGTFASCALGGAERIVELGTFSSCALGGALSSCALGGAL